MNMNPMAMIKALMGKGMQPQEMVMDMLKNNSNPMLGNVLEMAQKGDTKGVENFARNVFKEKGKDFDSEFSNFMNNFR